MNLNELLMFVKQMTEPEVSEQVLEIVQSGFNVYIEPLCETIAKSCEIMHRSLMAQGFTRSEAMEIVVAFANKGKGGS